MKQILDSLYTPPFHSRVSIQMHRMVPIFKKRSSGCSGPRSLSPANYCTIVSLHQRLLATGTTNDRARLVNFLYTAIAEECDNLLKHQHFRTKQKLIQHLIRKALGDLSEQTLCNGHFAPLVCTIKMLTMVYPY